MFQKQDSKAAAKKFSRKALNANHNQRQRVNSMDKYKVIEIASTEEIYSATIHCKVQNYIMI